MGFFDMFKKKPEAKGPIMVGAAVKGTVVPMDKIPDEVFSSGALGQCCGIDPAVGEVCAPADATITMVAETLHAVGLTTTDGAELLIHVGVDTVDMNGDGFAALVKADAKVKKGQKLLTMDLDKIRAAGHPTVVVTVVTNSDDLASVELVGSGAVEAGDDLFKLEK